MSTGHCWGGDELFWWCASCCGHSSVPLNTPRSYAHIVKSGVVRSGEAVSADSDSRWRQMSLQLEMDAKSFKGEDMSLMLAAV